MEAMYWIVILVADLFSILLGGYSLYLVIDAFLNSKDLMKYQGNLLTAVFAIVVVPLIITYGGLAIYGSETQIGLSVEKASDDSKVRFASDNYNLQNDEKVELQIYNTYPDERKFTVEVSCTEEKCKNSELLVPEKKEMTVKPGVTFDLPVAVKMKNAPEGKYSLNISVKEAGKVYDSLKVKVN